MPRWLTKELRKKVRKVFEPRYKRKLSNNEVVAIANNLVSFVENYAKFRWRMENEKQFAK